MHLTLIAAVAENGVIGRGGDLPWRLSTDLRRFKRLTMGHAILMGRKTWESIGRPLPGRTSIVLSSQADYPPGYDGVFVASDLEAALAQAARTDCMQDEAFVIGGAQIYAAALPLADRLLLTRVHAVVAGDATFPEVDWRQWQLVSEEAHTAGENDDHATSFQVWQRVEGR